MSDNNSERGNKISVASYLVKALYFLDNLLQFLKGVNPEPQHQPPTLFRAFEFRVLKFRVLKFHALEYHGYTKLGVSNLDDFLEGETESFIPSSRHGI